jgi:arylsulfatase A-like enzyme
MVPYAESVNLPLVMRWPRRIAAGRRTDILQTPMDYLPTLCRIAGIDPPAGIDGKDLSPTVLGRTENSRDAVLMANYVSDWDFFDSGTSWPEWRGVRTQRHTYVKWLTGKEELYDNQNDPYQMKNLAENQADLPTMKKLRGRLKDLLAEAHDEFLPGTAYADWYDDQRRLIKTATGPA